MTPAGAQVLVVDGLRGGSPRHDVLSGGGLDARFSVVRVDGLGEAFTRLRTARPACIVLDLNGRGDTGVEAVIELRAAAPDVPLVVVADPADVGAAVEASRGGAQDWVVGEVDEQLLGRRIGRAIRRLGGERRLESRALRDPGTGLANRTLFIDRLRVALARAVRMPVRRAPGPPAVPGPSGDAPPLAVILLDAGPDGGGEEPLRVMAARLEAVLRPADTVARLAGGEFAIICEPPEGDVDVAGIARRLQEAIAGAAPVPEGRAPQAVAVGVAFADGGTDPQPVLRNAELALHHARRAAGATVTVYRESMRSVVQVRRLTEPAIRRALEHHELRLMYQPMVDLAVGAVEGVEALLRWATPDRGVLWPAEFLPAAEETGMIVPMGAWVLRTALQQTAQWQAASGLTPPLVVSVNLSAGQLGDPDLLGAVIGQLAAARRVGAPGLALEFGHAAVVDAGPPCMAALQGLRASGVRLVLDRVGEDVASMERLGAVEVDAVKLDPELVADLPRLPAARAIAERLAARASGLGVSLAAAGVETAAQLAVLRSIGCRTAQGHLFAKAMPAKRVSRLLLSNPRW